MDRVAVMLLKAQGNIADMARKDRRKKDRRERDAEDMSAILLSQEPKAKSQLRNEPAKKTGRSGGRR
jgi:hypothetical protein